VTAAVGIGNATNYAVVSAGGGVTDLKTDNNTTTLVETIHYKYRFGRTMGAGIGLYSTNAGYWLWGFGEGPYDRYELWRIDQD